MWKATIASLRAHKLRLGLTAVSIVLGVAFVSGTLILSDTLGHTFDALFGQAYDKVSVQVRQPTGIKDPNGNSIYKPLPQSLVQQVAAIPGVKVAHGSVLGFAQMVDKHGKAIAPQAPTLGTNWDDTRQLSGFSIKAGRTPTGSTDVVIDAGTASKYGFHVGDRVKVLSTRAPEEFNIVGIARFGSANNLAGATFAIFDTPTAQQLLDRQGQFDTINTLAKPGVSAVSLRATISNHLPSRYEAITGNQLAKENANQVKKSLSFLTTFLLIFALVSLFVGSFIILNTFAILVTQRTREVGLLRALGASRRQVLASTLGEASVVGLVASVVGIAAGAGVALGLQSLFSGLGFALPSSGMVFKPRTAIVAVIVGLGVTLAASVAPARKASRISPIAALGDPIADGTGSLRRRGIVGTIGTALGLALMLFGLFATTGERGLLVGAGIAATFIGIAVLAPIVARPIAGLLGRPLPLLSGGLVFRRDRTRVSGTLARNNAMRNPRRTSATAAALMVGLALVTMFSVFAESAKASVGSTLDRDFSIDYLVGTTGGYRPFSPSVEQKIAAVPGVGAVSPLRTSPARYGSHSLTIDGVNPGTVDRLIRFDFTGGNVAALGKGQLLVEDGAARSKGWKIGQPVRITFPKTGTQTLIVGGTFKKNQLVDNYVVSTHVYEANFDVQLDQEVLIKAAPGVNPTSIRPGIERAAADLPNLSVQDSASVKQQYRHQVNQLLGIIYVLLGLSVIIAVIGIINTLVLSVTERTRELGLLRAVGMVRKQVKSMVRGESVVIALFGAVLGLGIGTAFGVALTKATQSSTGTALAIPIKSLVAFVMFAAGVGVLAAMWPARRAARLNVLDSLDFD